MPVRARSSCSPAAVTASANPLWIWRRSLPHRPVRSASRPVQRETRREATSSTTNPHEARPVPAEPMPVVDEASHQRHVSAEGGRGRRRLVDSPPPGAPRELAHALWVLVAPRVISGGGRPVRLRRTCGPTGSLHGRASSFAPRFRGAAIGAWAGVSSSALAIGPAPLIPSPASIIQSGVRSSSRESTSRPAAIG